MGTSVVTVMIVMTLSATSGRASQALANPDEYRTLSEIEDNSYVQLPRWAPSRGLCIGTTCSGARTTTADERNPEP
jgi:hypothetical protein